MNLDHTRTAVCVDLKWQNKSWPTCNVLTLPRFVLVSDILAFLTQLIALVQTNTNFATHPLGERYKVGAHWWDPPLSDYNCFFDFTPPKSSLIRQQFSTLSISLNPPNHHHPPWACTRSLPPENFGNSQRILENRAPFAQTSQHLPH